MMVQDIIFQGRHLIKINQQPKFIIYKLKYAYKLYNSMAAALIGNIMRANIKTNISATDATGIVSGSNQVLASNILANPTLGSGNYTYQWSFTGTTITFTAQNSNSTNCTYANLSTAGSTTIYCTVTDTWTGVKSVTGNCVITWPVQTITQNIVISGSPTYNGSGQAYTLTASTGPAPTGSPASFTNAGTYTYPTNITSITPSAGYTIGTVTGSFTIAKATCTASGSTITLCPPFSGYNGQQMSVSCGGLFSTGIGTLTVYLVNKSTGATTLAPLLPDTQVDGVWNGSGGANPKTGLSNGTNTINMLFPSGTYYYGFSFGGNSNYNASGVGALNGDSCNT